jgi:flagellar biosynthetic protein FliR
MNLPIKDVQLLVPVTVRILSALMVAPVFSHQSVPAIVKIVLAGMLAWLLVLPGGMSVSLPTTADQWLAGIAGEALIGLLLGALSSLAFWGLSMAGELVGLQIGWNFPATLHAGLESSPAPTGQLYSILGTLIFLVTGCYQLWLRALAGTFVAVPPFGFAMNGLAVDQAISLISALFAGAVQLALPVMGTLLLVETVLAFMTRVLPQFNAWVFGMPLKVGVGLLAIWLTLPVLVMMIDRWLQQVPAALRIVQVLR